MYPKKLRTKLNIKFFYKIKIYNDEHGCHKKLITQHIATINLIIAKVYRYILAMSC